MHGAIHTPLYGHSTFAFPDTTSILDVVDGKVPGALYTRYGMNPTITSVEEKLAAIEGSERALVFASGMAAISAAILTFAHAGDHVVCVGDVYGGTYELLSVHLPSLGIQSTFLLGSEVDRLAEVLTDRTRIVFFETPTNPIMEVLDIAAIARHTKAAGALTVVDNTFATPVNQRPLELGADLVVHSATKYLGGHSDLTGGVVLGRSELLAAVWGWRKGLGQILAPECASLLARSLRTLPIRVRAHNEAALELARRLHGHPRVVRVLHPGLPDHPGHEVAARQMSGFGGMLSMVLAEDAAGTAAVVDKLRLFSIAPSLGGVESLVTQPVTTTHHGLHPDERARRGIVDGLVRLSIGLEDVEDLWADLEQALGTEPSHAGRSPGRQTGSPRSGRLG
jgi:cystathionine gamma-synthase/methionine-gamma-lyase